MQNSEKNECIDAGYARSAELQRETVSDEFISDISKKCGFTESSTGKNQISCLIDDCVVEKKHFLLPTSTVSTVCCSFGISSVINSTDFIISDRRHDDVVEVNFNQNPKIEFLPVSIFLKFSNVQFYKADRCAIREISKRNFEHLIRLEDLNLAFNRIQTIKHDTFEGLSNLKKIMLSEFVENFLMIFTKLFFRQ